MGQSCHLCKDKQDIILVLDIIYLAFLQIEHVVSRHLVFNEEVLNSKVMGPFRSPVTLLDLIQKTLDQIEGTGTESKFNKYFEHEYYKDESGQYNFYWHRIQVPKNSSMECQQESSGSITKFGCSTNFKSSGKMENSAQFSQMVQDGIQEKDLCSGGLEDTSPPLQMQTRPWNDSSFTSQQVIINLYLRIVHTLFVKNCSNIRYQQKFPTNV